MKIYLKLAIIFVTFQTSASWACTKVTMVHQGKKVELCHDQNKDLYLSKNCPSLEKCFFDKKITLKFYSNQSPGFSLCYQLGGDAFFGSISGVKDKVPMCQKKGHYADQESLLLHYKSGN